MENNNFNLTDSSHLVGKKTFDSNALTNHSTNIVEKMLNGDELTYSSHVANFYPSYLSISLCWKKYT